MDRFVPRKHAGEFEDCDVQKIKDKVKYKDLCLKNYSLIYEKEEKKWAGEGDFKVLVTHKEYQYDA